MPVYKQDGRLMSLSTPLGADVLLLETFAGTEALSAPFAYDLGVLTESPAGWKFEDLLGQPVTVTMTLPADGAARYFNGVVAEVGQGELVSGVRTGVMLHRFTLRVVPKFWLLGLKRNSRIFQQLTVIDILKKVMTGLDVSWQTQGTYEPRDYCVQYRETDLAFASRLMEEEGIYFYFKHADGSHQMVVADKPAGHAAVPGPVSVSFQPEGGGLHPDDRVMRWTKRQQLRSGKVTLWDQCFELPGQHLDATKTVSETPAAGTKTHKLKVGGNEAFEVYDFPGGYAQRFDGITPDGADRAADVQKIFQDNARTAGIRLAQQSTGAVTIDAAGNVRHLSAGHKFTLADHPDADGDYVITRVTHDASNAGVYVTGGDQAAGYRGRFECQPVALPFVPPMTTPRPTVPGPQTAVVVGPSGEEIFTDKYSRIKVQFPWDREGANDANSSCWVRVGTPWAGKQWGMIHIPRVGQEVVVAFEEGDPDRPIVVGSVYNAEQMPPYVLPDNKTQSGLKTRSSLKGTEENFNELRFEDKKDEEQIYFHAEKNFDRVVENNDTLKVGFEKKDKGDQTIEIWNNRSLKVGAGKGEAEVGSETIDVFNSQAVTIGSGKGDAAEGSQTLSVYKDRTTTVETGNETLTVKKGNRVEEITEGNDTLAVKKGNREASIDTGNDTLTVKTGDRTVEVNGNDSLTIKTGNGTIKASAGKITIEAATGILLKVGGNSIEITPAGITVKGVKVAVQGDAQVEVKAPITQVSGDGMLTLKGGVTMIN
ncbi:MAG: type VI secretion system Vgr family protein [Gemmataceae bacterium]